MLNDSVRNSQYREAIHRAVEEGCKTVLDIGTGTGLLRYGREEGEGGGRGGGREGGREGGGEERKIQFVTHNTERRSIELLRRGVKLC